MLLRQNLTDDLRSAAWSVATGAPLKKRNKPRSVAEECDARSEGECASDDASAVLLDNGHFSEGEDLRTGLLRASKPSAQGTGEGLLPDHTLSAVISLTRCPPLWPLSPLSPQPCARCCARASNAACTAAGTAGAAASLTTTRRFLRRSSSRSSPACCSRLLPWCAPSQPAAPACCPVAAPVSYTTQPPLGVKIFMSRVSQPDAISCCFLRQFFLVGPWAFYRFAHRMPAGSSDVLLIHQIKYRCAISTAAKIHFRSCSRRPASAVGLERNCVSRPPTSACRVDNWFSANRNSKALALLILSGLLIAFGTAALLAASGGSFYEELWAAVAGVGIDWDFGGVDERTWLERVVAVFISIGGMLVTALMLGIVSDAIGEKMDDLRKGNSNVLESGHSLILGWNDRLLPIVKQIALANISSGGGTIVVLADRDKEEMDFEVRRFLDQELPASAMGARPNSRSSVICRKGSCILMKDLKTVSVGTARSIIVLTETDDADAADAQALRIVLSLSGLREKDQMMGHVVAEVSDLNNEPLVALLGGDHVETVVSEDVLGLLMLQCARQPGLAFVYDDLLGFEGCEFYVKKWPELVGRNFGDVVRIFSDAVPCGVYSPRSDGGGGGRMVLNPPDSYVVEEGDEIVVIAEDEDSYAPLSGPVLVSARPPPRRSLEKHAEKVVFFGWRRDMADLIRHLDELVRDGSELWLFNEVPIDDREEIFEHAGLGAKDLKHLTVRHFVGDPVSRADLSALPLARTQPLAVVSSQPPLLCAWPHGMSAIDV